MVIKVKKEVITGGCNSCGWKDKLDNAHKLAAYIIKNPPKNVSEFKKDDKEKPKEETKEKEKEKEKEKDNSKKTSKKDKKAAEDKVAAEVIVFFVSSSPRKKLEKPPKKRRRERKRKKKPKKSTSLSLNSMISNHKVQTLISSHLIEDQLVAKIREVYKKHSAVESFEDQDAAIKDIIDAAKALEVPSEHKNKLSYLLFLAIFDLNIAKEISKNSAILKKAQEDLGIDAPEQDILMNLEKFLTIKNDFSVYEKFVPTILKFFYDDDLLTEEYLVEWYDGKHNSKLMMDYRFDVEKDKKFRQASKSFVEWLK
jgi:translation initiation factor 5